MAEYAPQAIVDLYKTIERDDPTCELSGIIGDQSHSYGYHRARYCLPNDDYSVTSALDRKGDGWAASALDVKFTAAHMVIVTRRLLAAAQRGDYRLAAVREFYGTLNGTTVTGFDLLTRRGATSDDSHLWHVHLSIFRSYANDGARLQPIADVIAGRPIKEWDEMATEDQIRAIVREELQRSTVGMTNLIEEGNAPKGHRIQTVIRHELQLLGLYPYKTPPTPPKP